MTNGKDYIYLDSSAFNWDMPAPREPTKPEIPSGEQPLASSQSGDVAQRPENLNDAPTPSNFKDFDAFLKSAEQKRATVKKTTRKSGGSRIAEAKQHIDRLLKIQPSTVKEDKEAGLTDWTRILEFIGKYNGTYDHKYLELIFIESGYPTPWPAFSTIDSIRIRDEKLEITYADQPEDSGSEMDSDNVFRQRVQSPGYKTFKTPVTSTPKLRGSGMGVGIWEQMQRSGSKGSRRTFRSTDQDNSA